MRAHLLGGEDLLPTIAAGAQMIKGIFKFQTQRPSHLSPLLPVRNPKCQMFRYDPVSRFQTTAWSVPCLSGGGRGVPATLSGAPAAMNEDPRKVLYIARKHG